jgi:hypothetical protein
LRLQLDCHLFRRGDRRQPQGPGAIWSLGKTLVDNAVRKSA